MSDRFETVPGGDTPSAIGRVRYPSVFEPRAFGDDDPTYGIMLIFSRDELKNDPKQAQAFAYMKKCLDEAAEALFETDYRGSYKNRPLQSPFRTHENSDEIGEDEIAIRLKTKYPPKVWDETGENKLESKDDFYDGCKARVFFDVTAFDTRGNRGTTFKLVDVQRCGLGVRQQVVRKSHTFGAVETPVAAVEERDF